MVRGVGPPPTPPPPNQVEPPAVMLKPEPEADLVHPPTVLHVFLIRASDLPMMDYNWMTRKGSSDPVVSLKIDSQDKVCKSKVQSRTVNPVWNEHFALPSDDGSDALVLTIDDYDMLSANDFMGTVRVPVGSLAHREFRKETFPVTDARGELKKKGTWGTVELCLRWVYDADFAFPIPAELAAPEPPELAAKEANAVRIFLIRGRNLPIADKNLLSSGGSSDPMVTFASGKQVLESTVVKKSLSPIWEETFELRADDVDDAVAAVVDDWDLMSGNDFMGKFWIELQPLAARTLVRRWYALRPEGAARKAGASAVAGKQARAAAEDASLGKVELACRWLHLKQFDLPPPDVMVADERYPDEKPNALHVFLIRGKNLPVMDKNVIGGGGSSDPLVTVSIEDERKTSKVKKKNLEPIWSEHFEFPVEDLSDSLKVVCDDWDLLSGNDFMGQLDVPIRLFADRELHRQWWFLCNEHGREHTDLGKLEFAFRLYHNPAYVFPTPVRFLGVHDRALESEREFRLHSRRIKKETDERRGYKTTDTVQLVPVGDGLERFFLRIKFLPGIYGQLRDSYCCMSKALLLKDRRGEWAVFDCPTQVDFRRTFPKNLRDFIQTCFESGYELEGEGNVTKRLSSAIYNRDDITLYLDAPGELYDFFEEQLFDFFAR